MSVPLNVALFLAVSALATVPGILVIKHDYDSALWWQESAVAQAAYLHRLEMERRAPVPVPRPVRR